MPNEETPLFPPEHSLAIEGLLWLGYLTKEISFAGHIFVLRTLKASEELEAGLLAKEYEGTFGVVKANAWAQLAAAIESVDNDPKFWEKKAPPIGPSKRNNLLGRFNYITENWYWPVAAKLFDEYANLLREQALAFEVLEDLSSRTLSDSWSSSESSIGPGSSIENHQE